MPEIIVKFGDDIRQKYLLYKDLVTIGRSPENEIAIENLAVSRRHAEIVKENGAYVLEDLNSANGTFVNGVQVTRTEIVDKDVISIGKHKLYFYNQAAAAAPMDMAEKTMLVTRPALTKVSLRVTRGKQKDQNFELNRVETRIGRAADNEIRLGDWFVSKHHAEIVRKGMVYVVRDLGSWRHTMVNGQIIDEQVLKPGDEIQFGPKISMVFEVADGTAAREGSGRKPVELEGADAPLPFAASNPQTPLPIASSAPASAQSDEGLPPFEPEAEQEEEGESWDDEDFDPQDYVDDDSVESLNGAEAASEHSEPSMDDHVSGEPEDEESYQEVHVEAGAEGSGGESNAGDDSFQMSPIRLDEEQSEGGWEAAAEAADEESSGQAEPESQPEADDHDSVSLESAEQVEWVEEIAVESSVGEEVSLEAADAEPNVESAESEALESEPPEEERRETSESEDHAAPETPEVEAESPDAEACEESGEGPSPVPAGESLADIIMAEHGEANELDRAQVEMWATALENPSKIIRKQAQRQLKKLTGQVYDIEQ